MEETARKLVVLGEKEASRILKYNEDLLRKEFDKVGNPRKIKIVR